MAKFSRSSNPLFVALLAGLVTLAPLDAATKSTKSAASKSTASKPKPKPTPRPAPRPAPKPAARPEAKVLPVTPALAPGELPLAARAAILIDGPTGKPLYEKAADALEYPASSTKILTALLVLEAGDLDKIVRFELPDTKVEPSSLGAKVGEEFTRRHLLYALLLKSCNDVAMALARDNAGSVEAFADKMNERALQLGATSSHFVNPHGLHDPHHFVTARDLALIARTAMQNQLFRDIVSNPGVYIVANDRCVWLRNHNRLLTRVPGCTGIKTGFTNAAQQVLVSAAMRNGHEVISVVLHTNKPGIWEDSRTLLAYGFEKLGLPVLMPGPPVGRPAPGTPAANDSNPEEDAADLQK